MSTSIGIAVLVAVIVAILLPAPLDSIWVGLVLLVPFAVWAFRKKRPR